MTENKKFRAPRVAITRGMVEVGKATLDALTGDDAPADITDDQMIAEIFFSMWRVYWEEIEAVRRKKRPALLLPPKSSIVSLRN